MDHSEKKQYLTPYETANLLMVSPVTVRVWAQKGLLRSVSTPGGHRRFLREDVERFAQQNAVPSPLREADGLRVLIVDDDRQFAVYLRELLEGLGKGISTALAHDGFGAGCQIHTFKPGIVLLDLMMPGLDGFRVCRQIKQEPATVAIRVIAITGYPSPEHMRRIREDGAEACLGKPLDREAFLAVLGLEALP